MLFLRICKNLVHIYKDSIRGRAPACAGGVSRGVNNYQGHNCLQLLTSESSECHVAMCSVYANCHDGTAVTGYGTHFGSSRVGSNFV